MPPAATSVPSTQDTDEYVLQLTQQLQARFDQVSERLVGRIDDMAKRIDELESSISHMQQQVGGGYLQAQPTRHKSPSRLSPRD